MKGIESQGYAQGHRERDREVEGHGGQGSQRTWEGKGLYRHRLVEELRAVEIEGQSGQEL